MTAPATATRQDLVDARETAHGLYGQASTPEERTGAAEAYRTTSQAVRDFDAAAESDQEIADLRAADAEHDRQVVRPAPPAASSRHSIRRADGSYNVQPTDVLLVRGADGRIDYRHVAMDRIALSREADRALDLAFRHDIRLGPIPDEHARYLVPTLEAFRAPQQRASGDPIQTGSDAAGGYAVPPDTSGYREIVRNRKAFMGVEHVARIIMTGHGREWPIPTIDDTATDWDGTDSTAANIAENALLNAPKEVAFSEKIFKAHLFSSGGVPITWKALRDIEAPVETWFYPLVAERIGRLTAKRLADGTGVAPQPEGILTAASKGLDLYWDLSLGDFVATSSGGTTPDTGVAVKLEHAVDLAYRSGPGAAICMSDDLLLKLRTTKDKDGRLQFPWLSFTMLNPAAGPLRLGGLRIQVDPNFPVVPTAADGTAKVATVGDHQSFWVRKVAGMHMVMDPYTKANRGQVLYYVFEEMDSHLVRADAVKHVLITVVA